MICKQDGMEMARNMAFASRKRMIKNDYTKLFSKMKCKIVIMLKI